MRKLFKGIVDLVKENGFAMIAIVAFLSFFIMGSIVRCTSVHNMSDKMPKIETSPEDKAESALGGLASLRKNYTEDITSVVDLLRANLWVSKSDEGTYMRFTDKTYTETNGKAEEDTVKAYVIEIAQSKTQEEDDGTRSNIQALVIRTADWVDFGIIRTKNNKEGKPYEVILECNSFDKSKTYLLATEAHELKVDGPSSAWLEAHNITSKKLETELKKWCSLYYPTVTEVTWDSQSIENYGDGTSSITFTLNTKNEKKAKVTINTKNGSVSVEKA